MTRIFLTQEEFESGIINLNDAHHLTKVLRMTDGDLVELAYEGSLYIAKLQLNGENLGFTVIENKNTDLSKKCRITLIQGLPKGEKTEEIIKHGTELNVDDIILVNMKRSIAKIEEKKLDNRLERFNKIAKEASQQTHRLSIPKVTYKRSLKEVDYSIYDKIILLDEEEAKKEKPYHLNPRLLEDVTSLCFIVGPEGGIDPTEREYLLENKAICVALGKNILRTETASLSMLAILDSYQFE